MGVWRGVLAALCVLSALSGTAEAATPAWLDAQRIEPGQAALSGVSCPSATTCVAAGPVPVIQDGGPSFEPSTDPDPGATLNAVSCAPATRFCVFVDSDGGAFTYDSGTFGTLQHIDGTTELESVSCSSPTFCMAIDHNDKVFKYSGNWDGGNQLLQPSGFTSITRVACVSSSFCIALAGSSSGDRWYLYNGSSWVAQGLIDVSGGTPESLSCTSTSFCMLTDEDGSAIVYGGSSWSSPVSVDTYNGAPVLHSACVGTSCVGVDFYDNVFTYSSGAWAPGDPANIHAATAIAGVEDVACATATLCVAVDGLGDATTYALPPNAGSPAIAGTATVGQALTLTHAPIAESDVWRYDDWRRCDNPDAGCTFDPISTSQTGYTLASSDAGEYLDVREVVGFGFDEEGPLLSNIVGPISDGSTPTPTTTTTTTTPSGGDAAGSSPSTGATTGDTTTTQAGTAGVGRGSRATRGGVVTLHLTCSGGPCAGVVRLSAHGYAGHARYSIAAGRAATVKIKLTRHRRAPRIRGRRITVTLVIAPAGGTPQRHALKLNVRS